MENYEKIKVIGRGAHGTCLLCENKRARAKKKVIVKMVAFDVQSEEERNAILSKF